MDKNTTLYTILFSFVVTFFFVIILSIVNTGTKSLVENNEKLKISSAVLETIGIEADESEILDKFSLLNKYEFVDGKKGNQIEQNIFEYLKEGHLLNDVLFEYQRDNDIIYAKGFSGPALWGNVDTFLAFNQDISKILGFGVLDQEETPGLGARIEETWYKNQFKEQSIPEQPFAENEKFSLYLNFFGGLKSQEDKEDGAVDSITGATRTTDGINAIVNRAISEMKSFKGGN